MGHVKPCMNPPGPSGKAKYWLVWALPLSLAATEGITDLFSFLPGTKMFQFPDLPPDDLCIQSTVVGYYSYRVAPFRYPRIKVCNDSPWHFAVCCVFLRLLAPRYSPCALSSLTNFLYILLLLRALNVFPGLLQKQNWYRYGFLTKYTVFRVHILATLYVKGLSLAKTCWQGWSNLINKWCDYNIKNRFNIYIIPKIITFKTS